MPLRFALRAYDAPGNLAAAKQAMNEIIQASEDGGSVCVRNEGEFTEHLFFAKHSCTRDIDGLYGTFSVCCDLKADSGMKGTLVFSCFDAFFQHMRTKHGPERCFYDRHVSGSAIPLVLDIDGVPMDQGLDTWDRLASRILEELSECMAEHRLVRYTADSDALTLSDFAVFQCPKQDQDGNELFSLHLHAKEHFLADPHQHRELMKAFSHHLAAANLDLGVDASIYDLGKPLRLPYSCKKTAGEPRILLRVDRTDQTVEDWRESMLLGLLTKREGQGQLIQTDFPGIRARSPTSIFNFTERGPTQEITTAPHELQRVKQLAHEHFRMPNLRVLHGNDKRVVFEHNAPLDCARCGVTHTSNTNFYISLDRDCQPCTASLHCYQAAAHPEVEPALVLGAIYDTPHNYTFSPHAAMAMIEAVRPELEKYQELTEEQKKWETEKKACEKARQRPNCTLVQADNMDTRIAEIDMELQGVESSLAEVNVTIDETKLKVAQYIDRFYRVVDNDGSGAVYNIHYFYDPANSKNDRISSIDKLRTTGNQWITEQIKYHNKLLTFCDGEKGANAFEVWFDWEDRKRYSGVGYYPTGSLAGARNPEKLNLFTGLAFEYEADFLARVCTDPTGTPLDWDAIPAAFFPNTWQVLKERTEHGCDMGDNKQTQFLCYWIHCLLTEPGCPVPVMHVLYGKQGTGKSLLASLVRSLVGAHNTMQFATLEQMFHKDFQGHLANKLFFSVSEVGELNKDTAKADDKMDSILKDYVDGGEEQKYVVDKGQTGKCMDMIIWLLCTTNNEFCVTVSPEERRKNLIDGTRHETDTSYDANQENVYGRMAREMKDRSLLKIIFHWLYEMEPIGEISGASYFKNNLQLPQTPYMDRCKAFVTSGGDDDNELQTLVLNLLTRRMPRGGLGTTIPDCGDLFDSEPLITMDGNDPVPIAESVLLGDNASAYFKPAAGPHPSHIMIPVGSLWQVGVVDDKRSLKGRATRQLLYNAIEASLPVDLRDWYKQKNTKNNKIRIDQHRFNCVVLPYGPNGSLLKAAFLKLADS